MKKFKDWFENNLTVGPFPYRQNQWFQPKKYDISINVSDEYYELIEQQQRECGLKTYWFPMNEAMRDIGLNSIYGAMVVMYNAEQAGKRVYLHCHAGINRSHTVSAAYYYMRTGQQLQAGHDKYANRLYAQCARGYLPPLAETEKFLKTIAETLEAHKGEPTGGHLDHIKINSIRNF